MRIDKSLWEKYCNGQASLEELKALEAWLQSDTDHEDAFRKWAGEDIVTGPAMPEAMAGRIRERLQGQLKAPGKVRSFSPRWMAAASVMLVVLSGAFFWVFRGRGPMPVASVSLTWDSIVNRDATVKRITLPDQTNIWLNRNAVLYVNRNFGQERQVRLEGEAYFEVSHDENHPFRVLTGKVRTTVLGTAFNIDNSQGQSAVYVSLLKGSVAVGCMQAGKPVKGNGASTDGNGNPVILHPGEMATASLQGGIPVTRIGVPDASGWIKGDLVFNQLPLAEALLKLERFYGLTIEADPALLRGRTITAVYHRGESWQQVLHHLLFIYQLSFREKENHQVRIIHP